MKRLLRAAAPLAGIGSHPTRACPQADMAACCAVQAPKSSMHRACMCICMVCMSIACLDSNAPALHASLTRLQQTQALATLCMSISPASRLTLFWGRMLVGFALQALPVMHR